MTLDQYLREDARRVRERRLREEDRLPAGQSLTLKWPVLHEGDVPAFDLRVGGYGDPFREQRFGRP